VVTVKLRERQLLCHVSKLKMPEHVSVQGMRRMINFLSRSDIYQN